MMTKIGALKTADPKGWERLVRKAMSDAKGRVPDAAVALGVSPRQLFRWLQLGPLLDIPRVEHGLPRDGRRGRRKKGPVPGRSRPAKAVSPSRRPPG